MTCSLDARFARSCEMTWRTHIRASGPPFLDRRSACLAHEVHDERDHGEDQQDVHEDDGELEDEDAAGPDDEQYDGEAEHRSSPVNGRVTRVAHERPAGGNAKRGPATPRLGYRSSPSCAAAASPSLRSMVVACDCSCAESVAMVRVRNSACSGKMLSMSCFPAGVSTA